MLDEFRSTSITWDKATRRIYSPITANASDSNGRKLNIQVVNSGQVENLTGATLHLYWETKDKAHDGLDAFDASDISKGEFELFYTTGMLSNVGELNATLVLVDSTGKVVSDWFKITVTRGINEGAIQSENSFTTLTKALIDISNLEQNYAPRLNDLTAQLQQTDLTITDGGLDRIKATGKFLTNMTSWIGLLNTKFLTDNATRFYILPKDHVTTGVGGCLKIFADAYQDNQDYRDLGIYFSADQAGDIGYYGNGVNWINVKVLDGGMYAGKHPDLGFSFQDGAVVAGRITCYGNARAMWVFGPGLSTLQGVDLIAEFKKDIGFVPEKGIRLFTDVAQNQANTITNDATSYLKESLQIGKRKYVNGVLKHETDANKSEIKNALVTSSRANLLTDASTVDVTGVNRVVINQPSTGNNISTVTGGLDGQEIILINVAGNTAPQHTTIVHGTTIKLSGGANFSMGFNSTLTLINISGTWYEKCRSVNA